MHESRMPGRMEERSVRATVITLRQGPCPPRAVLYNHSQQVPGLAAMMETEVFKLSSLKVIKF